MSYFGYVIYAHFVLKALSFRNALALSRFDTIYVLGGNKSKLSYGEAGQITIE